ncbi:golgin subfamily A member 2-like protein [Caulobacter phage CcrBL9]|uniref:Golgin subfamily A member 2-like protein n=1 Tax=Caulobacter phage CcrBL9 TaxID=2283270 RepID=A0A385EED4_9CAUD|nr:golgin subfamily A member 2-like protein [Caulobacter phage CcrBL9]AXQ69118.1 golgin subfamily A member 2-like protein [Caulobacter phage CcrBL9]
MIAATFDKIAQDLAIDEHASPAARLLANAILLRVIEDDDLAAENEALDKTVASLKGRLREAEGKLESAYQIGRDGVLAVQNIEQAKYQQLYDDHMEVVTRLQALEVRLKDVQEQPVVDETLVAKLRRDIKDYQDRDAKFQDKIGEFREANIKLLKEREEIAFAREALNEENDSLAKELDMADAALQELHKEWRGMEARALGAETAHDALQGKLKRAETSADQYAKRVEGLEKQLADSRDRVEQKTSEHRAALANMRDLEQQNIKLRTAAEVTLNDDLLMENAKLLAQVKQLTQEGVWKDKSIASYQADALVKAPTDETLLATVNAQAAEIAKLQAKLRDGFEGGSIEHAEAAPVLVACQSSVDLLSLRNNLWQTTLAPHLIFAVIGEDKPAGPLGGIIVMPTQAVGLKKPDAVRTHDAIRKLDWLADVKKQLADGAGLVTIQPQ